MRRMTSILPKKHPHLTISIHILHAEDDVLPAYFFAICAISIHILHAEDDFKGKDDTNAFHHFNPHPPCGG